MILSYHPCIVADHNLLCAGRDPDNKDLRAIRSARAVVLPQGCRQSLFEMAEANCAHVFPDYRRRFAYPDKIGQARLFAETGIAFPKTETFENVAAFHVRYGTSVPAGSWQFPLVFKFNWGGEGHGVHLVPDPLYLSDLIGKATQYEQSGQSGFLFQAVVPTAGYALRVVVIGEHLISYWRVQLEGSRFKVNAAAGAEIDKKAYPVLQERAQVVARQFCAKTGINLAGIDFLFPLAGANRPDALAPMILEINYFFGRRGIGDSGIYYDLLRSEVKKWLLAKGFSTDNIE